MLHFIWRVHMRRSLVTGCLLPIGILSLLYGITPERLVVVMRQESTLHVWVVALVLMVATGLTGLPRAEELEFLKIFPLSRSVRGLYCSLRVAWASLPIPVLGIGVGLASAGMGTVARWDMGLGIAVAWCVWSLGFWLLGESIVTGWLSRPRRHLIRFLPPWFRKEWGLLFRHPSQWLGPCVAVMVALGCGIVLPSIPPALQLLVARGAGLLLCPLLVEGLAVGILGAEGRTAWLHAVASEPAYRALLRKGAVALVACAVWLLPYCVVLVFQWHEQAAVPLGQLFCALVGLCVIALIMGTMFADFHRAGEASGAGGGQGLIIAAALWVYTSIWLFSPIGGMLITGLLTTICMVWLRRQERFTWLRPWRFFSR